MRFWFAVFTDYRGRPDWQAIGIFTFIGATLALPVVLVVGLCITVANGPVVRAEAEQSAKAKSLPISAQPFHPLNPLNPMSPLSPLHPSRQIKPFKPYRPIQPASSGRGFGS